MLKERFLAVTDLIKEGIIEVVYQSECGQVEVSLPKTLWLQLTGEDLLRAAQGNLNRVFHRDVQSKVVYERPDYVIIRLNV